MALCSQVLEPHGLLRNAQCLQAHSINQCTHLLECSLVDLMELGNFTREQAELARDVAAAALAPPLITFTDLLSRQTARRQMPTGINVIDEAMGGGLLNGSITEIVGPAGAFQ